MTIESKHPVQTFRDKAIGVSIWERIGSNGPFYEFTVSRSYKKSETESGYSHGFGEAQEEALVSVIRQAASWIREQGEVREEKAA